MDRRGSAEKGLDRREFIRRLGLGAAALATPATLLAAAPTSLGQRRPHGSPLRIRGRVRSGGMGLARVGVSDGLHVVESQRDGSFEIITTTERNFLHLCVPAGYAIPRSRTGTARAYMPIPDSGDEMDADFVLERLSHSDANHTVLLLADPQTQDEEEMGWLHEQSVPDLQALIRELDDDEVLGVACGDIMYDNLGLFPGYERAVARLGIPFFQVVGNHDLDHAARTDEASTSTFSHRFGPPSYSFERGEVHYVVLDDVFWYGSDYLGYLDATQLEWLRADLARVEAGRTVIVALHIPVLGSQHVRDGRERPNPSVAVMNRESLYELLEPYEAHILAGHMHESEHLFENGVHEHVCGAVCGAWWSGPICGDGTPNGYGVYEIRGSEVIWRYKSTGYPSDHQIRAYGHGADPAAPDEIVANVWDWDPEWTVVWFEDGERRGAMARRIVLDPLSVALHTGPDLPPRRTWVDPYRTGHLFYAPASRSAREILIEATDRFGRVHTTVVPRS